MNREEFLDGRTYRKDTAGVGFDGVIHKNSKGFHDGTIYDEPLISFRSCKI